MLSLLHIKPDAIIGFNMEHFLNFKERNELRKSCGVPLLSFIHLEIKEALLPYNKEQLTRYFIYRLLDSANLRHDWPKSKLTMAVYDDRVIIRLPTEEEN